MIDHPAPADEGRHTASSHPLWNESWYFDFHDADGSFGGYVRLGLYPNLGVSWFWACVVGRDRQLVSVCDHDAPLPRRDELELRASGLITLRERQMIIHDLEALSRMAMFTPHYLHLERR